LKARQPIKSPAGDDENAFHHPLLLCHGAGEQTLQSRHYAASQTNVKNDKN
jgi:hypothetical protein